MASISSPIIPSFIGTRIRWNCAARRDRALVGRDDALQQPLAAGDADADEDDEPEREPDRAGVARGRDASPARSTQTANVRDRADDRGQRDRRAPDRAR